MSAAHLSFGSMDSGTASSCSTPVMHGSMQRSTQQHGQKAGRCPHFWNAACNATVFGILDKGFQVMRFDQPPVGWHAVHL